MSTDTAPVDDHDDHGAPEQPPKRRRVCQRVIDSYNGIPCDYVRPDDAPVRPGEVCGEIHDRCRAHVKAHTEREEAIVKRGDPCGKFAIPGGLVCASHGGRLPQVRKAAAARLAIVRAEGEIALMLERALPLTRDRSPVAALDATREHAGAMVLVLGQLVGALAAKADADVAIVYDDKRAPHVVVTVHDEGVVGPKATGDLATHPLVALYGEWVDRSARIEKLAIDAGLEERRVALEEADARAIFTVVTETLTDLGVDITAQVRQLIASKFRALDAGAAEVIDTTARLVPAEAASGGDVAPTAVEAEPDTVDAVAGDEAATGAELWPDEEG